MIDAVEADSSKEGDGKRRTDETKSSTGTTWEGTGKDKEKEKTNLKRLVFQGAVERESRDNDVEDPAKIHKFGCVNLGNSEDYPENYVEQENEIKILQAIYPDNFTLETTVLSGGLFSFAIAIAVQLPYEQDSILVEVIVPADINMAAIQGSISELDKRHKPDFHRSLSGKRLSSSVKIKHLPPMSLHVSLPAEYPSFRRPFFTLSCIWLGPNQLSALCKQLDKLWLENDGVPVIYTWIDWLQNNTVSFLGCEDTIVLKPVALDQTLCEDVDGKVSHDPRAIYSCTNIQSDLCSLLRYDYEEEYSDFSKNYQICNICFLSHLGSEFFRLPDCGHHFCKECMTNFCEMHVQDGTVVQIQCPESDCKCDLPVAIIQEVLQPDAIQRWESFVLQRALDQMGDIVWCPRCQTPVVKEPEDSLQLAVCLQCNFPFCCECEEPWHQGQPCGANDVGVDELLKSKGKASNEKRLRQALAKREKAMSMLYMKKAAKMCPKCKAPIEKEEGCNKMTCSLCHTYFCWACGKKITGYDHFNGSGAKCNLFTSFGPPQRVDERPDFRPLELQVLQMEDGAGEFHDALLRRTMKCPRCHQINLKIERNNHCRCWACKSNVCFYCKKLIAGNVNSHFASKLCLQHS